MAQLVGDTSLTHQPAGIAN